MCKTDVCNCPGPVTETGNYCMCNAIANYARRCALRGVILDWRSSSLCPVSCDNGMEYRECGNNCFRTCRNIQPENCREECVAGCQCPGETVWSQHDLACVERRDCGCYYSDQYFS